MTTALTRSQEVTQRQEVQHNKDHVSLDLAAACATCKLQQLTSYVCDARYRKHVENMLKTCCRVG